MNAETLKIAAAREALGEVRSGMTLGLGSGSTSNEFVKLLGKEVREGRLRGIRCTSTSVKTEELARAAGLEICRLADVAPLDLAVDGADEVDASLRLIKGRGGALLREKIVEQAARRFLVIVDESKLVARLGVGALPVEVTPFALEVLTRRFAALGLAPELRLQEGRPFVTDEQNHILDLRVPAGRDIADVVTEVRRHAGVVETGFFPDEASEVIVAAAGGIRRIRR
ncbi:MAG TPA: ribose-5-phosphate isomerase RpiA [Thermoanaerobaculia bacterium]|nr:ribose-5-phosphate isomerase RpiA [Thermoanaerobaculia bacterium]